MHLQKLLAEHKRQLAHHTGGIVVNLLPPLFQLLCRLFGRRRAKDVVAAIKNGGSATERGKGGKERVVKGLRRSTASQEKAASGSRKTYACCLVFFPVGGKYICPSRQNVGTCSEKSWGGRGEMRCGSEKRNVQVEDAKVLGACLSVG